MVENQETMMDPELKIILLLQNSLKAYIYLVTWFMSSNSKSREGKEISLTKQKRGKKNLN